MVLWRLLGLALGVKQLVDFLMVRKGWEKAPRGWGRMQGAEDAGGGAAGREASGDAVAQRKRRRDFLLTLDTRL